MNKAEQTQEKSSGPLKFRLRTMQMDLEEAKSGVPVKETEVSPAAKAPAPAKVSFEKIARELKPASVPPEARVLEKEVTQTAPPKEPKIELRPLEKPKPKLEEPKKPTYKPEGPPLRPHFELGRELELAPQTKKRAFKLPKSLGVVLIIVVLASGFFTLGGWEFIRGYLGAPTIPIPLPGLQQPTQQPPPSTQPPATVPELGNPLVNVAGVTILEVPQAQERQLGNTIRSVLAQDYPLNSLTRVAVIYQENKQPLSFKQLWRALSVIPPFGLIDTLEENFNLVVYTSANNVRRFGVVGKLRQGALATHLKNQLLSWEEKFINDWQILLSSVPVTAKGQFQNATIAQSSARFINTDLPEVGIYYAILQNQGLLLVGTSQETLEQLIVASR